jgi:hypothetical protein
MISDSKCSQIEKIMKIKHSFYCRDCSSPILEKWKGWPLRDKIPALPIIIDGECEVCGGTNELSHKNFGWINVGMGLPSFWYISMNGYNSWGLPYYGESECPYCQKRSIISQHGTELCHNCQECGVIKILKKERTDSCKNCGNHTKNRLKSRLPLRSIHNFDPLQTDKCKKRDSARDYLKWSDIPPDDSECDDLFWVKPNIWGEDEPIVAEVLPYFDYFYEEINGVKIITMNGNIIPKDDSVKRKYCKIPPPPETGWSDQPPECSGWYWIRDDNGDIEAALVYRYNDDDPLTLFDINGCGDNSPITTLNLSWLKIPLPE